LTNEKCVQEVVKAIVIIIPKAFYLTFKDSILYWHNNILPVLQLACLFNYFIGAIPVLDFGPFLFLAVQLLLLCSYMSGYS